VCVTALKITSVRLIVHFLKNTIYFKILVFTSSDYLHVGFFVLD